MNYCRSLDEVSNTGAARKDNSRRYDTPLKKGFLQGLYDQFVEEQVQVRHQTLSGDLRTYFL